MASFDSRRIGGFRGVALTGVGALALGSVFLWGFAAAPGEKPWMTYGGDAASSRFFDSQVIDKSNVSDLEIAWVYPHAEATFHPLMVHGVFYGRVGGDAIVAVDAKTGELLWVHDGLQGMTTRGVNYWESDDGSQRRLIFVANDYLQQIDAVTGLSVTDFGDGGVVDLREGLHRDASTIARWQSPTPGQVFEDLIILGSAPGEGYFSADGAIRAYDILTGDLAWKFNTIPAPGEFGHETWPADAWRYAGATNAWGEISIDVDRAIAFVPTGSPSFDYYGADRHGTNLFANSLLALDARTGERLWHFQTVHHDLWDLDLNAAPMLTTIRKDGRDIDIVAQASKTGFVYVFERETGEPIWPIEERPVAPGTMAGEYYHPTQPFPTLPAPFIPQSFSTADISQYDNVSPEDRATFMERWEAARRGTDEVSIFSPIDFDWTMHVPGANGGALFGMTTAEPNTGLVYVVGQHNPTFVRLYEPEPPSQPNNSSQIAARVAAMPGAPVFQRECAVCHGANLSGTANAPTLRTVSGRLAATDIRELVLEGYNRMPAMPHVTSAEADQLAAYILEVAGAGVRVAGGGGGGGGAAAEVESLFPADKIVQTGPAKARTGPRATAPTSYPEGVEATPLYHIRNQWNSIGVLANPPYTTITAYDLNEGSIRWQKGFGDDIDLAAMGITETGSSQMRNSVLVTASGLLFGVGHDGKLRAWDTDTGEILWSHQLGALGTANNGSPTLYEIDGEAYLVVSVPASRGSSNNASDARRALQEEIADLPTGYIAFSLPTR